MVKKVDQKSNLLETLEVGETTVESFSNLFKLDPGVGIWSLVVFILLFIVLKKIAWVPILKSIKERDRIIRDSLEQVESVQSESKKLAKEQQQILLTAKLNASKIIIDAKEIADKMANSIRMEVEEQKQKTLQSGLNELQVAQNVAKKQLQQYVATLAVDLTEKLIRESLDKEKQNIIVDKFLKEVKFS